ncbi:MAG: FkbM family methyltransferase [Pseudomonadota bacterium]
MENNKFITCLADIPEKQTCIIYGAGKGAQNLYSLISLYRKDIKIIGFLDTFQSGELKGLPITKFQDYYSEQKNIAILIATEFWYEVESLLLEKACTNYLKIPLRFLFDKTLNEIKLQSDKTPPKYNTFINLCFNGQENDSITKKLNRVERLLTHIEDKKLYQLLTRQNLTQQECITAIVDNYFSKKPSKQYLDFINPTKIKTMIDGGVYDGKETVDFFEVFSSDLTVYGFEPNTDILLNSPYFKKLQQSNFIHIKKGLWQENKQLYFDVCGSSSHISYAQDKDNLFSIDVTSIDDFVKKMDIKKIDFIKLDIEGAELESLHGAINIITTHRPQLAICIYHKQSDFYEIPLYLDSILNNYHFRLGHYTAWAYETVWYAIPNELKN